ncbi:MAG: esterase-like activity of phytase family protein [Pseudomonadota bacterium]
MLVRRIRHWLGAGGLLVPALAILVLNVSSLIAMASFAADRFTDQPIVIHTQTISNLAVRRPEQHRFGRLRFDGGLWLTSPNPHLGAVSGLRLLDANRLVAVTDTGFWLSANIERDADGRPRAIASAVLSPMRDRLSDPVSRRYADDLEAVTVKDGAAFVTSERYLRVLRYDLDGGRLKGKAQFYGGQFPWGSMSTSFGLESLATLPAALSQRLPGFEFLTIVEGRPYETSAFRAFFISESRASQFRIARRGPFLITDADFLPSGDLLILERYFSTLEGARIRIRRIPGADLRPQSQVDGTVLVTLGPGHAVDNMEGLSVFQHSNGDTRIALISDDNKWPLQRTLYLEFTLLDD